MRKKVLRSAGFVAVVFLTLTFTACNEDQLKAIATNVDRVALLVKDGREIRDELEIQGIISPTEGRKITIGLIKVNGALKAFNDRAKGYASDGEITPARKAELVNLATDISSATVELISNGTFGIKNPDAQVRVNSVIGSLKQVTLTIVDTVTLIKAKGEK